MSDVQLLPDCSSKMRLRVYADDTSKDSFSLAIQLRFTRRVPLAEPDFVSDTDGAALVSVTLLSDTRSDPCAPACAAGGSAAAGFGFFV